MLREARKDEPVTFLPMVERELRMLARKPSTYRWRWIIGGMAFGLALLLIMMMGLVGNPKGWGSALFGTLTVYAAMVCVMAGLFGTADILSEERREGTLGLLFLTDLKGYDVVLGKFSAVALNALYWLLAIIPVLSLPLLLGGVTFGEFLRVSLGLMNLLVFAMAIGTWSSGRVTEVGHSLAVAAGMLVLFGALLPGMFAVLNLFGGGQGWSVLTFSPTLVLFNTGSARYGASPDLYWYPLLSSQLMAWTMLAWTSWQLPRVWHKPIKGAVSLLATKTAGKRRASTFEKRAMWLDTNPAMFLMRPAPALKITAIGLVIVATCLLLIDMLVLDDSSILYNPFMGGLVEWLALLPLKLLLVVHACRFFATARQSGVFELLLSTPLTTKELVAAHWTVIHRIFLWPFIILSFYLLFGGVKVFVLSGNLSASAGTFGFLLVGMKLVGHVFDYFLLGWMGAWMGLKLKRPGWAPFFTILFALVLPSFLCWLGFLIKPVLIAVSRHYVVYELPRLVRKQFDGGFSMESTLQRSVPPPLA